MKKKASPAATHSHTSYSDPLLSLAWSFIRKKCFNRSSKKKGSLNFFVLSCFRYPRYQRIIGHMSNCLEIFGLQLRLYGPVAYLNFKFFGSILDPTRNSKFRGGARRGRHSIVQVFSGQGPERGIKLGAGRVLKIRVFCTPYVCM